MAEATSGFRWPDGAIAAVSFSFDDARESQVERGLAILADAGVRATFYVSPDAVVRRRAEWRGVVDAGHEIGNHTMRHPCSENFPFARERPLERYTAGAMLAELVETDERIADLLGVTPSTFAYPCGQTYVGRGTATESYVPIVAGRYLAARGFAEWAVNDPRYCNLHQLASFDLDERSLPYVERAIELTAQAGGWTIFAGHEIGDASARQTTGAAALAGAISRIREMPRKVWVDTVAAVAGYVRRYRSSAER